MTGLGKFWQRITEGMELNQLWKQFHTDARTSYRLYSRDVDSTRTVGTGRGRHALQLAKQFFWAVIEKLTPARRVLLVIALVLLFINGGGSWQGSDGHVRVFWFGGAFWGGLLLLRCCFWKLATAW